MNELATIILSVFGLIGVGYASARSGLLASTVSKGLTDFVFVIAIPVLLFKTLATADFSGVSPWPLWITYFSAVGATWLLSHKLIRFIFHRDARSGVVAGVSATFSNTVLIGIPLVQTVLGDQGVVALLIILSIHLPVMMLASVILYEWALRADGVDVEPVPPLVLIRRFVINLAKNPIIVGIVAGGIWRLGGLPITGIFGNIVSSLAQVAGPMALFSAGMGLASYGIARNVPQALVITACKLMVMPALVLLIGSLTGLPELFLATAVITAGCPTGVNAYLIASRFGIGEAISSNAMTLSVLLGTISAGFWVSIVGPY